MYRISSSPALGKTTEPWKGVTWRITLQINSRQSVVAIECEALRVDAAGLLYEGVHDCQVAPFDDLKRLIRDALEESALASHKDVGMQISLFDVEDPFPA